MSESQVTSEHDEIEAMFSSYYEDELDGADKKRVAEHLEGCEACQAAYKELARALEAVAGLGKVNAPAGFEDGVESTIERRSAGRFFGERRLTDRLPLTVLALLAIAIGVALVLWLRGSETGSLKTAPTPEPPLEPEVRDVLPQP
jgi:anti-sigma factor RsiW